MQENRNKFLIKYGRVGLTAFIVIIASVLFFFAVFKFDVIASFLGKILSILQPVIFGVIIAYMVNPMSKFFAGAINKFLNRIFKSRKNFEKPAFYCGIGLALAVFVLIIFVLFYLIIPSFINSITSLLSDLPHKLEGVITWVNDVINGNNPAFNELFEKLPEEIKSSVLDKTNFTNWINYATENIGYLIAGVYYSVVDVVTVVKDFILGLIVAAYALASKSTFRLQANKLLNAFISEKTVTVVNKVARQSNEIFNGYINGKLINALIIGIICFIGVTILGLPYPMLITVVIAVTDLIPIFGPYIGTIPCALLILLHNPVKCLYFLIFIVVLQTVEGNIISPKILGESTGLASFWVVFAILLGGGLFGILGMLLAVPVFAVLYYIVKSIVDYLLTKKGLPTNRYAYAVTDNGTSQTESGDNNEQKTATESK